MGIGRGENTVRTSPAWTPSPVPSLPSPCLLPHPNLPTSIWGSVEPPAVTSQQGPVWLATNWRQSEVPMSREGRMNGTAGYFLQIWHWSKEILDPPLRSLPSPWAVTQLPACSTQFSTHIIINQRLYKLQESRISVLLTCTIDYQGMPVCLSSGLPSERLCEKTKLD